MSYHGLDARFVPIVTWPGPRTRDRKPGPFRSTVGQTVKLLKAELAHLGARDILIQMEGDESQIRRDGYPRADARFGPGVIVTFVSKHGPLSYPCDRYKYWDQNLRAIALALQALRAVDRYGVTRRGEQYTGWKALPGAGESSTTMTALQAAAAVVRLAGSETVVAADLLKDPQLTQDLYRIAAKRFHPDRPGGSHEAMTVLSAAKRVLDQHHGAKR